MTGSIGLPEFFMDESKWQLILLVYFGAMMFGMPIMVWRWCVCIAPECDSLTLPVLACCNWWRVV